VLGAGDANVLARYSLFSARIGRKREAADAMRRALVLDPLNPLIHRAAGAIQYAARNYADSIPPAEHALSMNPRMSRAHAAIGDALLMSGRSAEARAAYELEPAQDVGLTGKAIVEWKLKNPQAARAAMTQLVAELGDRALYQQGQVLAQWGEKDAALAKLERARVLGDSGLIYARNDPLLDGLRSEPRFVQLLASVGFDPVT
jgi:tetratricopeptide (TPR) repeat protein